MIIIQCYEKKKKKLSKDLFLQKKKKDYLIKCLWETQKADRSICIPGY